MCPIKRVTFIKNEDYVHCISGVAYKESCESRLFASI